MILSCQHIEKSFVGDVILHDVSFQLNEKDKLAIVGENGAGKSTLLKIITGEMSADGGDVVFAASTTIGYLAQYQNIDEKNGTIYDILLQSCADLIAMKESLHEMERAMADTPSDELDDFMQRYHTLNDTFIDRGGLTYESEIKGILKGLGFAESDFTKTMAMLSGGQKTRVSLGCLLIQKPDILLLDEPINHLDLSSIEWLEGYLSGYKRTIVVVAHDRYFLDHICDHVLDLSMHESTLYKGNYTAFVRQKRERMVTLQRSFEKQQAMISHQREVIDQLKQFNREKSIKRAESREKMLDKVEVLQKPIEQNQTMRLSLEPETISGKDVLEITGLSKSYDGRLLFSDVHLFIERSEHVAIIGDNGTGKTTLLKIIHGAIEADRGTIKIGSNVKIGYYDQEQQVLDDEKTLFDEMSDAYPSLSNTRIRNVLAAFLFTGEDCYKKIGQLSGGERGRISLAKLMLSNANFLILDEPTNHLDMESKEILENAINSYTGTVLYVSHDRYFINQTAQRILELDHQTFSNYLGNYDDYLDKKSQQESKAQEIKTDAFMDTSTDGREDWKEQKRLQSEKRKVEHQLAAVEKEIAEVEEKIDAYNIQLQDPQIATNFAKLNEISAEIKALEDSLMRLYETWDELSENELLNI